MLCCAEIEDAFSVFDTNGSGKIKISDVFPLIRSLGHNPLEAAVWVYMNELGLTGWLCSDWFSIAVS